MDLASIRIITHDVDRLARFYEAVTATTAARPAPVFAEFRTACGTLAVASTATVAMLGDDAPRPGSNESIIIEFLVTDVDAEFDRLRDVLDDVVLPPTTMPWGNRSALFRDPDGNLVNLFSRPAAP
ncbi:VOC family protein [Herbiconiux sp. P15]|uniref:VOC family protein n=1 Tax=Herbiconiux liukaitaii TaxID=3342799 RepID=UPI0035B7B57D